uniref:Immunoglobulin subtype domain-containing protein n=1 Tax=Amphimedon queenslandica TaxID=400682 RepID=A0A1X7VKS6_AMPQE
MFLAVLLLLLSLSIDAQGVSFKTVPPHIENEDVIITADNDSLVHLYCAISIGNELVSFTTWDEIHQNGTFQDIAFSSNGSSLTHNFIESAPATMPLHSNLTFNLTQATSHTKLSCNQNDKGVTFFIGILALPELSNVFANVTEGSSFNTSLAGSKNNPFPPPQGTWSYGDDPITSVTISTNTYSIEFASTIKNQSGVYTLTLTNDAGTISGNLTLNVQ